MSPQLTKLMRLLFCWMYNLAAVQTKAEPLIQHQSQELNQPLDSSLEHQTHFSWEREWLTLTGRDIYSGSMIWLFCLQCLSQNHFKLIDKFTPECKNRSIITRSRDSIPYYITQTLSTWHSCGLAYWRNIKIASLEMTPSRWSTYLLVGNYTLNQRPLYAATSPVDRIHKSRTSSHTPDHPQGFVLLISVMLSSMH